MQKNSSDNMQLSLTLRPHQEELLQLSELAGIQANPAILKILIELLNMKVEPHAIYRILKSIRKSNKSSRKQDFCNKSYSSTSS